jgi:hypothetical protein
MQPGMGSFQSANAAPDRGRGPCATDQAPACYCVGLSEKAIDRRRGHGEDARSNRLVELQMTVLLQRRDEHREKRPEALATDPV